MALLDREVKYLINKAKIWKPKQESPTNHTESTNENATNTEKEQPESEPVPKSATDSHMEGLQNENTSENEEVQTEKSSDTEESTKLSNDNEPEMIHESIQEEVHQEL